MSRSGIALLIAALALAWASAAAYGDGLKLLDEGLQPPTVPESALAAYARFSELPRVGAQASWRNAGSARELQGLVCVEHIFVHDTDSDWPRQRRVSSLQASREAMAHLRKLARSARIDLRWRDQVADYYSGQASALSSSDHAWTREALLTSFVTPESFRPVAICPRLECEERLAILYVAQEGRSYALPSIFARDGELERAVMFMRSARASLPWSDDDRSEARMLVPERPASFAHELLHLFGAEDLYEPDERRRAAQERYPDDLMLQSHRPLDAIEIGEYTAYSIGWSDEEPAMLPTER